MYPYLFFFLENKRRYFNYINFIHSKRKSEKQREGVLFFFSIFLNIVLIPTEFFLKVLI
jgi:hypothetical protein